MANSGYVQVPTDSTGKKIDCASLSAGGTTVYRQAIVVADPNASAGYATVTGGALNVGGTVNVSAMPALNISTLPALATGSNQIGYIQKISATIAVTGTVQLVAGVANFGTLNNISATVAITGTVQLVAGTANFGTLNNISAPVVLGAGAANIGTINGISAAVTVSPHLVSITGTASVVLAAGTANIGSINNISATVNVAGTFTMGSIAAGTNNIGTVGISSGTFSLTGTLDGISATISTVLAAGAANIGFINNISATVNIAGTVFVSGCSLVAGSTVGLAAGANNIGSINNISAAVIVAGQIAQAASVTAGNSPVLMGGRVKTSASTTAAAKTAIHGWFDKQGRQVVQPHHPSLIPSSTHGPRSIHITSSAAVALIAAPGAGVCAFVTGIWIMNAHPTTATELIIYDGANSASPIVDTYLTGLTGGHNEFQFYFDPPFKVSANTALNVQSFVSVQDLLATIHFYTGPD